MVNFKDLSRPLSVFQVLFKTNLYFQGLFKTVLYIQVLFKPVRTLNTEILHVYSWSLASKNLISREKVVKGSDQMCSLVCAFYLKQIWFSPDKPHMSQYMRFWHLMPMHLCT